MNNLRKPNEVILKDGRNLEEVLELHKKWLNNKQEGERANLHGEDLTNTDLSCSILIGVILAGVNLKYADLSNINLTNANLTNVILTGADLSYSILTDVNLSYSNLKNTNLSFANLTCVDLSYADLRDSNLSDSDFYLTNLYKCKGDFVGVENIGSRNDTTHYFYKDDRVICGCFSGTMEEFEDRVKDTYEEDDKEYKEYMIAIRTLKELAEIELESNI